MKTNRFLICSFAVVALAGASFLAIASGPQAPTALAAAVPTTHEIAAADEPVVVHFALARDTVRLSPEARANLSRQAIPVQYSLSAAAPAEKPPFYQDPNFIGWAVGTISAIAAVFMRRDASRKQRALQAVIVGVERATQLPQVQAAASQVKQEIQRYAVANGVQDHLHDLVQKLTDAMPQPEANRAPSA